jgi:hypothetical protein
VFEISAPKVDFCHFLNKIQVFLKKSWTNIWISKIKQFFAVKNCHNWPRFLLKVALHPFQKIAGWQLDLKQANRLINLGQLCENLTIAGNFCHKFINISPDMLAHSWAARYVISKLTPQLSRKNHRSHLEISNPRRYFLIKRLFGLFW